MAEVEEFRRAIKERKVPIVVLDQKWHRLFAIHGKTSEIKDAEAKLNELLARQGKANTELKELKKLKNQLMGSIVQNMDEASAKDIKKHEKKMEESKRLIDEINEKMENYEDDLMQLPKLIKEANDELMLLSMDYFYEKLDVNKAQAKEIEDWINNIRVELKKNIIRKQNREINNREIYGYLHDVFGPEILDLFDYEYEEEQNKEETQDHEENKEEQGETN